jgi:hypothetical protein
VLARVSPLADRAIQLLEGRVTGRAAGALRGPAEPPEKAGKRSLAALRAFQDPALDDEEPEPRLGPGDDDPEV